MIYKDVILAQNPIQYYRLGESSGIIAFDEMSLVDGDYIGSPSLGVDSLTVADLDTAINISTIDPFLEIGMSIPIFHSPSFSIAIKTKGRGITLKNGLIISTGLGGQNWPSYSLSYIDDGTITFDLYRGNTSVGRSILSSGISYSPTQILDIIISFDDVTKEQLLSINNVVVATFTWNESVWLNVTPFTTIGFAKPKNGTIETQPFNGTIDEVSFFNRVLTQAERTQQFEATGVGGLTAIVSGNVKKLNIPFEAKVVVMNALSPVVLGETVSDPITGNYSIDVFPHTEEVLIYISPDYGTVFVPNVFVFLDQIIHPTTPNRFVYIVTVAGITGSVEPDFPTGGLINSGSVTFNTLPLHRPLMNGFIKPVIIPI